jgi:hypothetical protein
LFSFFISLIFYRNEFKRFEIILKDQNNLVYPEPWTSWGDVLTDKKDAFSVKQHAHEERQEPGPGSVTVFALAYQMVQVLAGMPFLFVIMLWLLNLLIIGKTGVLKTAPSAPEKCKLLLEKIVII